MKFAFIGFVTVVAIGCSGEERSTYPTAPTPSVAAAPAPIPDQLASVSVVVIETGGGGACVRGATVEVVSGQGLGRSVRQADRCSVWDPDYSANFKDMTPGAEMTLRASAEGYAPREVIVMPTPGPQVLRVEIELSRLQ
jgi:hypothetical protein